MIKEALEFLLDLNDPTTTEAYNGVEYVKGN